MEFRGFLWKKIGSKFERLGGLAGESAKALSLLVLEEFDLAQALCRFGFGFVGSAEVLVALLGDDFVAAFYFFDHFAPRILF